MNHPSSLDRRAQHELLSYANRRHNVFYWPNRPNTHMLNAAGAQSTTASNLPCRAYSAQSDIRFDREPGQPLTAGIAASPHPATDAAGPITSSLAGKSQCNSQQRFQTKTR